MNRECQAETLNIQQVIVPANLPAMGALPTPGAEMPQDALFCLVVKTAARSEGAPAGELPGEDTEGRRPVKSAAARVSSGPDANVPRGFRGRQITSDRAIREDDQPRAEFEREVQVV